MKRKIFTVSEITQAIKSSIESEFQEVWIMGEISNYREYTSGHVYFSMKDENAQINCVIFYFDTLDIKFKLEDGLKVIVFGRISVYPKRGEYRVIIKYVEPVGKGALQLAFEQLKEKLSREGLFDPSKKKKIPSLIKRIGIVTSPDGAAIKDILTTLKKNKLSIEVILNPVHVQGDIAKYEISSAISYFNQNYVGYLDLILVGRGGGSLEDLWPFNEEIVARAVASSEIPIVSCVGHEIDYTIIDFVADLRMPTPTAAAEFIVNKRREIIDKLKDFTTRLIKNISYKYETSSLRLDRILRSRFFLKPSIIFEEKCQDVDETFERLINSMNSLIERKENKLKLMEEKLKALSPWDILKRGYSIVWRDGKIVRSSKELSFGQEVRIKFYEGEVDAEVKMKYE